MEESSSDEDVIEYLSCFMEGNKVISYFFYPEDKTLWKHYEHRYYNDGEIHYERLENEDEYIYQVETEYIQL